MYLLLLALLPSIVLIRFVWKQDKVEKEPAGLLIKIFFFGVISVIPAVIIELLIGEVIDAFFVEGTSLYIIIENFLGVAIVEEYVKRQATKLAAWKHKAFNYKFDAIVYCIVGALGFATFENIFYVFENGFTVAITRAILSVPSHAIDGLIMGYFFGLAKEADVMGNKKRKKRMLLLSLIVPTIEHGFFDAALSSESDLILVLFFVFVVVVDIWAIKFIKKQSAGDTRLAGTPFEVNVTASEDKAY